MRLRIVKPGVLATVQDLGRHGHLSAAVPVSGAMDSLSARIANRVLGNADNDAVIEFTYGGISFIAETSILISVCGAGAYLEINGKKISSGKPIFIPAGVTVDLKGNTSGARTYLAITGGFDISEVMDSRSTCLVANFGGFEGRALQPGDVLSAISDLSVLSTKILDSLKGNSVNYSTWQIPQRQILLGKPVIIRVIPAHEFVWFSGKSITDFLTGPYKISLKSNRMGYQLEGDPIERVNKNELISTAVTPGTIQVTGGGGMILLMADCQTTGGYPRIAQVASIDMPLCAQLKPADMVYFEEISWTDAEKLYLEQEKQLQLFTVTIKNKYL